MNPYPNNPRRSPIQKSKEQETKEKELKAIVLNNDCNYKKDERVYIKYNRENLN